MFAITQRQSNSKSGSQKRSKSMQVASLALNHVHLWLIGHGINNEKLLFPFAF
jgi:hypothetical protein